MRNNSAKRKLAAGKPVSVVAPTYSAPGLVELLGRQGYDMIFIDCEHGPRELGRRRGHGPRGRAVRRHAHRPRPEPRPVHHHARPGPRRGRRPGAPCQHPRRGRGRGPPRQVRADRAPWLRGRTLGLRRDRCTTTRGGRTRRPWSSSCWRRWKPSATSTTSSRSSTSTSSSSPRAISPSRWATPGQMDHPAVQAAIDDAVKRIRAAGRAPGILSTPATVRRYLDLGALFLYVGLPVGPRARHEGLPRRIPARLSGAQASRQQEEDGHDDARCPRVAIAACAGPAGRGRRRPAGPRPGRARSSRRRSRRRSTPSGSRSPAASARSRCRRPSSSSSRRG